MRYGTASSRNASTPSSAQKLERVEHLAGAPAGFSKLRSGWWLKNRCQ